MDWQPIPDGATVTLKNRNKEEILFPAENDPDFVASGTITIDGKEIRADIGLREYVSGWGECFHDYEPISWRAVT